MFFRAKASKSETEVDMFLKMLSIYLWPYLGQPGGVTPLSSNAECAHHAGVRHDPRDSSCSIQKRLMTVECYMSLGNHSPGGLCNKLCFC